MWFAESPRLSLGNLSGCVRSPFHVFICFYDIKKCGYLSAVKTYWNPLYCTSLISFLADSLSFESLFSPCSLKFHVALSKSTFPSPYEPLCYHLTSRWRIFLFCFPHTCFFDYVGSEPSCQIEGLSFGLRERSWPMRGLMVLVLEYVWEFSEMVKIVKFS